MMREVRPDFFIIGSMKCATSTLHAQLAAQPGFWMSTPKEPNFFSDDDQYRRGMVWYRNLFAPAEEGDLRGESSTHYTKLPTYPETIPRLKKELGSAPLKFIYLMRHPVDRLVSHYIHEWSQGVFSVSLHTAVSRFPELMEYGFYAKQLRPWLDCFGQDAVLPLFVDGLREHPQKTLERVCRFLGYQDQPVWVEEKAAQNVSSLRMRKSPARDNLAAIPPLRWFRRTFIPESWREKFKRRWMMTERPQLGAELRREIEERFDQDLAILGEWLGLDLSCESWSRIAVEAEPQWVKNS